MYYDIKTENNRIKEAYKLIEDNQRIKLCIAYFQPYLKLMNSYQRIKELKDLKREVKYQKENQLKLENEINEMKHREIDYIKIINDLVAPVKILEKNQGNNNINANNEKDNNSKGKKNRKTTIETSLGTVVDVVDIVDQNNN